MEDVNDTSVTDARICKLLKQSLVFQGASRFAYAQNSKSGGELFTKIRSLGLDVLTPMGFCNLIACDLTFGGFGMPIPQFDTFLNVVALTTFQPYDTDILNDPVDILFVLTPIYRILCVNTAVIMHQTRFEQVNDDDNVILPYKPRSGFSQHRYSSLLEVVTSVWFLVCHAYVKRESKIVTHLACYSNGTEMAHVWLDTHTERLSVFRQKQQDHLDAKGNFTSVGAIVSLRSSFPESMTFKIVIDDLLVYQWPGNSKGRFLAHDEDVPKDALRFETIDEPPYMQVLTHDPTLAYFLLLTCDGGHFSAFLRNNQRQIVVYPLYAHFEEEEEDREDDEEEVKKAECCMCGKVLLFPAKYKNANDGRYYCGERCIGKMMQLSGETTRRKSGVEELITSARK